MNKNKPLAWAAPLVFVGVLFYWPLGRVLAQGLGGDWLATISNVRTAHVVWFTVWQALISSALSVLLALPVAQILHCRTFWGSRSARAIITLPFILPSIVVGIAFTPFSGLPTITRIVIAHVFMNVGIAVRIIGSVWQRIDTSVEEAAALDGASQIRVFVSVTLPQLKVAIASASALVFLYCASSFGVIMVLGDLHTHTLETEIYISATQFLDLPRTTGLSLIQTALTAGAFITAYKYSRGSLSLSENFDTQQQTPIQKRDRIPAFATILIFCTLIFWPLARIVAKAFTFNGTLSLSNFMNLAGYGARETLSITLMQATLNSLRNLTIATSLALAIGTYASYLLSRQRLNESSRLPVAFLDTIFQIPVGTSAVVLGFGYLITFSSGFMPLRSSWIATALVQALLAIPLVIRVVYPAFVAIDIHVHEAAAIDAARTEDVVRWIEYPLIRRSLLTAAAFAALVSLGEFGSTSFLAYGDQATLPLVLFQLISHPGPQNYGMAMATSFLLLITAFVIVYSVSANTQSRQTPTYRANSDPQT